ncbi:MAG: hypothetical protein QW373_07175 [Desulfurococcaceae archaeon]
MSTVTIELLDENSIGRYYQLAALSIAYPRVSPALLSNLEKGLDRGALQLDQNEVYQLFGAIADYLDSRVCSIKTNYGPKLYTAGTIDRKILSNAGIQVGKTLQCANIVNYLRQNVYQFLTHKVDIPMFLRTYVFSRYRDREEVEKTSVASLSLALAGIYISTIGNVRRGKELFEIFVNPDGSIDTSRSAHRFYDLLNEPGSNIRIPRLIENILDLEGVSLELSVLFATAIYVYGVARHVRMLSNLSSYYNVFERFRLVCISPGDRPLVLWERPLTITHIIQVFEKAKALDLLSSIERLASYSPQISEKLKEYPEAISACINDLHEYLETGSFDALVHCSGGVARLYDLLDDLCRRKNLNQACTILKTVRDFAGYLSRLI